MNIDIINNKGEQVIKIDDKKIKNIKHLCREYDDKHKMIMYISKLEECLMNFNPLSTVISKTIQRNEVLAIITSFPEEVLDNYIKFSINHVLKNGKKPLVYEYQICREVFEYWFESKSVYSNMQYTYDITYIRDRINNQYIKIIDEIVDIYIKENRYLKDIPNTTANINQVFNIFINKDIEKITGYIDYLLQVEFESREKMDLPRLKNSNKIVKYINHYISPLKTIGIDNKLLIGSKLNKQEVYKDFIIKRYYVFIESLIKQAILEKKKIKDINPSMVTYIDLFLLLENIDSKVLEEYIDYMIEYEFLAKRKPISFFSFCEEIIANISGKLSEYKENYHIFEYIRNYIANISDEYYEKLMSTNNEQISMNSNKWILVSYENFKYNISYFDFENIKSDLFRYEIKLFMKNEISRKKLININTLSLVVPCVNYLYETNNKCNSFAQISKSDIRRLQIYLSQDYKTIQYKNLSPSSISKMIGSMRSICKYLIDYSKENELKTKKIKINYFEDIKFKNIEKTHKRTEIIPEEVISRLIELSQELNEYNRVLFDTFINTGARLKQLIDLKINCIEECGEENVKILKFKESKKENYMKKVSKNPERYILIPNEVAESIQKYIDDTDDIRKKCNTDIVFITIHTQQGKVKPNKVCGNGFVKAINTLIKKHNITDFNNELWNFTSRQIRKTLVVDMIENGASKSEISYLLGHYNKKTLEKYYQEVRQKRIDDMNNEFFKKKFKIDIGEKNLEQFTEEERRLLYIDFISNNRRVELGFCTKHYKEGNCGELVGKSNCARCNKICTGKEFKEKWIDLKDATKAEIELLEAFYLEKNINKDTYINFKEYTMQIENLRLYEEIIDKIE